MFSVAKLLCKQFFYIWLCGTDNFFSLGGGVAVKSMLFAAVAVKKSTANLQLKRVELLAFVVTVLRKRKLNCFRENREKVLISYIT